MDCMKDDRGAFVSGHLQDVLTVASSALFSHASSVQTLPLAVPLGSHFSMSDSWMMRCSSSSSCRRRSSASSCSRAEISMAMRSCSS